MKDLSSGTPHRQAQLKAYAQSCVHPALDYVGRQLRTHLQDALAVFKAARLVAPHKMQVMQVIQASMWTSECLSSIYMNKGECTTPSTVKALRH